RCVAHDHPDSNYKLVADHLLAPLDGKIPSEQIIPINPQLLDDSDAAAADYQKELESVFGSDEKFPQFDCILLGIGPDGHTCSLFPGFAQLEEKSRWCVGIDNSPKPPPSRITLTMPVLNAARNVAFVVTGAGKRTTIKEIIDQSDVRLPASHVALPRGTVHWFLDDAASQDLTLNKPSEFKL
ncbi:suppressor of los1-1, partial [Coemansia sp. RSA 2703]